MSTPLAQETAASPAKEAPEEELYHLLRSNPHASDEEISSACCRWAQIHLSDKCQNPQDFAAENFLLIRGLCMILIGKQKLGISSPQLGINEALVVALAPAVVVYTAARVMIVAKNLIQVKADSEALEKVYYEEFGVRLGGRVLLGSRVFERIDGTRKYRRLDPFPEIPSAARLWRSVFGRFLQSVKAAGFLVLRAAPPSGPPPLAVQRGGSQRAVPPSVLPPPAVRRGGLQRAAPPSCPPPPAVQRGGLQRAAPPSGLPPQAVQRGGSQRAAPPSTARRGVGTHLSTFSPPPTKTVGGGVGAHLSPPHGSSVDKQLVDKLGEDLGFDPPQAEKLRSAILGQHAHLEKFWEALPTVCTAAGKLWNEVEALKTRNRNYMGLFHSAKEEGEKAQARLAEVERDHRECDRREVGVRFIDFLQMTGGSGSR